MRRHTGYPSCSFSGLRAESGISLLELAVVLPIIVLFVAGIIDYGSALREIQTISSASREGARIAASHSRIHRTVRCSSQDPAARAGSCQLTGSTSFEIVASDPVDAAARKSACGFIGNSGLRGEDWIVSTVVPAPIVEDRTAFDVITVKVEKSPNASKCIICWDKLLNSFQPKAESTFTLETNCAR